MYTNQVSSCYHMCYNWYKQSLPVLSFSPSILKVISEKKNKKNTQLPRNYYILLVYIVLI